MVVLFLQLLLAVGTKLEHVIIQLAHEVAEKHVAVQGDLVVRPSDDHFWFNKPKIVLILIHIILFQNSFELAFFFWIWVRTAPLHCSSKQHPANYCMNIWHFSLVITGSIWFWLLHNGTSWLYYSKTCYRVNSDSSLLCILHIYRWTSSNYMLCFNVNPIY